MSLDCLSVGVLVADHLCAPISHLPRPGELVLADRLELNIGGCASNVGIDLARNGVDVAVVGRVGQDSFGDFMVQSLASAGVDTQSIVKLADIGTSGTLIINVQGEDRRFVHTIGANGRLTPADVPLDRLRASKVFYVGGYMLMPAFDQPGLVDLFRQCRAWGITTVLDVVLPGPRDYWREFDQVLPFTDVFLPNNDEAKLITGLTDPREQAQRFLAAGASTVAITCGGEGTYLASKSERLFAPAHRVEFIGGTGAGDAFDAGYICGLLEGGDARRCLAWGSALGASCVRSISATESVFDRQASLAFMDEHPLAVQNW